MSLADLRKNIQKISKHAIRNIVKEEDSIERLIFTSPNLNLLYGGGHARGRIEEIYGNESTGKSLMSVIIAIEYQKQGIPVLWVDAERAFSKSFYGKLGLDFSEDLFILIEPESGESAFNLIKEITKSKQIGLIVVDSVEALVPNAELEADAEDAQMGVKARMMSRGLRTNLIDIAKSNTSVIFINQIRMKIGVMFGNPEVTPGGKSLTFYSSVRNKLLKGEYILNNDKEVIGLTVSIVNIKNKVGLPGKRVKLNIFFDGGLDTTQEYIDFSIEKGFIKKEGKANYTIEKTSDSFYGKPKLLAFLKENKEIFDMLKKQVEDSFKKEDQISKVVEEDENDN